MFTSYLPIISWPLMPETWGQFKAKLKSDSISIQVTAAFKLRRKPIEDYYKKELMRMYETKVEIWKRKSHRAMIARLIVRCNTSWTAKLWSNGSPKRDTSNQPNFYGIQLIAALCQMQFCHLRLINRQKILIVSHWGRFIVACSWELIAFHFSRRQCKTPA